MLKILFITFTHSNGGGAESLLTDYVNHLDKEKYSVCIQEVVTYDVKKEKTNKNIKVKKIPFAYNNKKNLFLLFNILNFHLIYENPEILKTVFRLNNFDCVVTWNYQMPSFMLPAFYECHRIAYFHGDIYDLALSKESPDSELLNRNRKQFEVWKKADSIITISKRSLSSLKSVFPELASKAKIITNGVKIDYVLKRSKETCKIKLNPKKQHLCGCGRLDKNKNFSLLVKAFAIVKKTFKDVDLVLIGDGELKEDLKDEARRLGVFDDIVFAGYLQNPFPLIAQCHISCLTSFYEGFPLSILEAKILGKPFVTTKVSGASEELLDGGKCGLVADWNAEDYAEKILSFLKDKEKYNAMKEENIRHSKEFSVEKSVEKLSIEFDKAKAKKVVRNGLCKTTRYYILYILYALFWLDKNWCKRNKDKKLKLFIYISSYLFSLVALPLKLCFIFLYLFLAGI